MFVEIQQIMSVIVILLESTINSHPKDIRNSQSETIRNRQVQSNRNNHCYTTSVLRLLSQREQISHPQGKVLIGFSDNAKLGEFDGN